MAKRTRKGNVTSTARKKHGTVGSKYPIFDKKSARSALKLINHAKPPLSAAQKARIRAKARRYGVGSKKK
jgi:hypothetical protein